MTPSILDLFLDRCRRQPDATAVRFGQGSLTYAELRARAAGYALLLRERGVRPGGLVGVAVDRCPDMVAALLGIFEVGAAYVPLDPHFPAERLAFMLADAGVELLVTQREIEGRLPAGGARRLFLDERREPPAEPAAPYRAKPDDLAYVMYTSGSTGRPKGVEVVHGGVVSLIDAMSRPLGVKAGDTVLSVSSLSFDMTVLDYFMALAVGARLVLVSRETAMQGEALAALIDADEVDLLQATPATFRLLLGADFRPRRPLKLLSSGEALPPDIVPQLLERGCSVWNGYGITEGTVYCTLTEVLDPRKGITVGPAIENVAIYILDEERKPVAPGVIGEIYIGGAGVARGYRNRPEVTAERFLPDPFAAERAPLGDTGPTLGPRMYRSGDLACFRADGDIEYHGRIDSQVQLRGYRVELGEIEARLAELPQVRQCAARAHDFGPGDMRLVAYVVPAASGNRAETWAEIERASRAHLAACLPEYMVPAHFVSLAAMPLSPTGKIDRGALSRPVPEREQAATTYRAPEDEMEGFLCESFARLLGFGAEGDPRVGVDDDFFALGGHSLLVARLVWALRDERGVALSARDVFEHPTPAGLARVARGRKDAAAPSPVIEESPRTGALPLSYPQASMWFIDRLGASLHYHVCTVTKIEGPLDVAALQSALDGLVARHEALRTTISVADEAPAQHVNPARRVAMPRALLDDLDPEEAEEQARASASELFRRPFDLGRGLPLRAALLRFGPERHRLLLCVHHVAADGWTVRVMFQDLCDLYAQAIDPSRPAGAAPALQYGDFAVWQRDPARDAPWDDRLRYWVRELEGCAGRTALPLDRPRPDKRSVDGGRVDMALGAEQSAALNAFSQRQRVTPFMTLSAAYAALLHGETGAADIPIGTLMANRAPEVKDVAGYFANPVVLRFRVDAEAGFGQLLAQARRVTLGAMEHQDVPFERVVRAHAGRRQIDQQPLFQAAFVLQEPPLPASPLPGLRLSMEEVDNGTSPWDLLLQLWWRDGAVEGNFLYRGDVFDAATIEDLSARYLRLLGRVIQAPDAALDDLARDELVEVEAELRRAPAVQDAAFVLRPTSEGGVEGIACVVSDGAPAVGSIQRAMERLPTRLRASCSVLRVARLPTTPSGRVDRASLRTLPVIDEALTADLRAQLGARQDVSEARVQIVERSTPEGALHLSALLPKDAARGLAEREPGGAQASAKAPGAERDSRPAVVEAPPLEMPRDAPRTLRDALARAARRHPDRGITNLESDGSERLLRYPELLDGARGVAAGWRAAGVQKGEPVLLVLDRYADFIVAIWACFLGGFIAVPLAPPQTWAVAGGRSTKVFDVARMLGGPMVVLPERDLTEARALARSQGVEAFRCAALDTARSAGTAHEGAGEEPALRSDDLCLLLLTSGSTGLPKPVSHTHETILRFAEAYGQRHGFGEDEVFLNWLGLDHVAPLFMCHISAVYHCARQVNAPGDTFLRDPLCSLDWVHRFRATSTFVPNFAFGLVNEALSRLPLGDGAPTLRVRPPLGNGVPAPERGPWDLSSFRVIANGGEMIVSATARRYVQNLRPHGLPEHAMVPIWGMSETSSATITALDFRIDTTSDDDAFVACGFPVPGFGMRIVDSTDKPLRFGEIGRLQVRGACLMTGYHGRPDANAASFTADGWFDTGDLAFIGDRGLTLTGRAKDEIIVHGINYHAHEIEAAVEGVAGVLRSFVAACAVREPGDETDKIAIFFAAPEVPEAEMAGLLGRIRGAVHRGVGIQPTYLLPVAPGEIPKTEIGKLQRSKLRQGFADGQFRALLERVDLLLQNESTLPAWFFRPRWARRVRPRAGGAPTGPVLLLGRDDALTSDLRRCLEEAGRECRVVLEGSMDATRPADWDRLLAETRAASGLRPPAAAVRAALGAHQIWHLWTLGAVDTPPSTAGLMRAQERGSLSMLQLLQALQRTRSPGDSMPVELLVVSRGAQAVGERDALSIEHAPLLGLLATAPQEMPWLRARHLDLDPEGGDAGLADIVAEAAQIDGTLPEVALRRGERLVPALERFAPSPAADCLDGPAPGTPTVISGGLGGIGSALSLDLCARSRCPLLLLGRTPAAELPAERKTALRDLQRRAGERSVVYAAVDVADQDALCAVVTGWERDIGERAGAFFHLAAKMPNVTLARETPEGLSDVLGARVLGGFHLGQLAAERSAMFVDFASINALFGGFSVGAYSAGNRFGVAWTHELRRRHGIQARALLWSKWGGVGIQRDLADGAAADQRGYRSIGLRQGLLSTRAALASGEPTVLIGLDGSRGPVRRRLIDAAPELLDIDVRVRPVDPQKPPPASLEVCDRGGRPIEVQVRACEALKASAAPSISESTPSDTAPRDEMERRIAAVWAEVLRVERVGVESNFFDLGGHSLLLVELQARLEGVLRREIPMVDLFRYPNVRALAAALAPAPGDAPTAEALREQTRQRQKLGAAAGAAFARRKGQ